MSDPATSSISTKTEVNGSSDGHGPVRPSAPIGAATRRDIHISEQGQHLPPTGPTRIATWRPIPGKSIPKPDFEPTPEQLKQIEQLKNYTEENLILDSKDEYYIWEKKWLDRKDTYSRYMRAADWKLENAKKRIKYTLEWRRSYKPDLIKPEEIRVEAEGGKVIVNGFDRDGRPIVYLRPSRENTKPSPTQIRHLIFQLERAIDLMPEGVEKLSLIVDYKGATSSNNPSMKTVKEVIHILQNHYVERLGKGIVVNVPFYLTGFFNLVKSLLDPKTKSKIEFNPKLKNLIPNQQLDFEFGGNFQYIYDSKVYLISLCHFCGIKEDGTREEIIPKDLPNIKPDELQRTITEKTGNTLEEEAEFARKEAEAQERQEREAREFAEKGTQLQFDDDDQEDIGNTSTSLNTTAAAGTGVPLDAAANNVQDGHINGDHSGVLDKKVGEGVIAGAAAASIAAATQSGQQSRNVAGHPAARDTSESTAVHTSPHTNSTVTDKSKTESPSKVEAMDHHTDTEDVPSHLNGAVKDASTPTQPSQPSTSVSQPNSTIQPDSAKDTNQTTTSGSISPNKQDGGRKRGGWKLFSSKRGLNKDGLPTQHKHKHVMKAFCMHKGAIDPSKATSHKNTVVAEKGTTAVNGDTEPTDNVNINNRIKIAPEATEGREERTYNNAPLATNATFGPDAYHTAMEAYPTTSGDIENNEGDYFTNLRKIPPVKPTNVNEEEKDQAKLVKRPTEILNRLHEGGTGDLILAFEVKQPPTESPSNQDASGEEESGGGAKDDENNATAEAATKGEEEVKKQA